jgi:hypothetical protein
VSAILSMSSCTGWANKFDTCDSKRTGGVDTKDSDAAPKLKNYIFTYMSTTKIKRLVCNDLKFIMYLTDTCINCYNYSYIFD